LSIPINSKEIDEDAEQPVQQQNTEEEVEFETNYYNIEEELSKRKFPLIYNTIEPRINDNNPNPEPSDRVHVVHNDKFDIYTLSKKSYDERVVLSTNLWFEIQPDEQIKPFGTDPKYGANLEYFVLHGNGILIIDNMTEPIHGGHTFTIERGVAHSVKNIRSDSKLFLMCSGNGLIEINDLFVRAVPKQRRQPQNIMTQTPIASNTNTASQPQTQTENKNKTPSLRKFEGRVVK